MSEPDHTPRPDLMLTIALAAAINARYAEVITFLNEQIRVLRELIDKKRLPLTDDQRRRLAAQFSKLDKALVADQELIVTPATFMRWYRKLIAQKWDYSDRATRRGRPAHTQEVVDTVLELLEENPTWGDDSISNRCANIGIEVSPSSVRAIRYRYGIPPAPERQRTGDWARFIQATWPGLAAMDFTTVETLDPATNELTTLYVLFAMRLPTREVHLVGITDHPNEAWMLQQARNLTDDFDGFFRDVTHCTIDNDKIFSKAFTAALKDRGVRCVRTCVRTPNMNAHIERFMLTFKSEAMRWVVPRGEWHLRATIREFLRHYHGERNHQGLGNAIIHPGAEVGRRKGEFRCRTRLGGALRYYHRAAA